MKDDLISADQQGRGDHRHSSLVIAVVLLIDEQAAGGEYRPGR
mgnify:CR=1 FL=1|tara:strand:+ start:2266 stop:2394 length:129 start_codon:yes stop_codon:yes gene_type:complete